MHAVGIEHKAFRRNATEITNTMNVRIFWGHDRALLAGSILKVLPHLKTKAENSTETYDDISKKTDFLISASNLAPFKQFVL